MKVSHIDDSLIERFLPSFDAKERIEEQTRTLSRLQEYLAESPSDEALQADVGRAWIRLGETRRLSLDYSGAAAAHLTGASIWRSIGRRKAEFLANLRADLAQSRAGELTELIARLDEIEADPTLEFYRDLVHDFVARLQFAQGEPQSALESMTLALTVRQNAGRSTRQIEATLACIGTIKSALEQSSTPVCG